MLTIGKLGAGQERYYLDKVAEGAEDYYSGEGEAEGRWLGDAAEDLGLQGRVGGRPAGRDADRAQPASTASPWGCAPSPAAARSPALTSPSPPRSRSPCSGRSAVRSPAAEVSAAHQRSVEAALDYMQREACWTRRGAGGKEFLHGNGYLAAAYTHRSSRNGDPQLHTHVLIANATQGTGRPLDAALPPGDL